MTSHAKRGICLLGLTVVLPLVSPTAVLTQGSNLDLFLFERSYAASGTPKVLRAPSYYANDPEPDLTAEAQLVGHFVLRRGLLLQELRAQPGFGVNFFLSTQFRLRVLDIESGPIHSPSFMPRFTGQALWSYGWETNDPDFLSTEGRRNVFGAYAVLGHHSNGGDGCVFVDESYDADGECTSSLAPVPPATQREVRLTGGNFSTNYVEIGLAHRWAQLAQTNGVAHWAWSVEAAAGVQFHHRRDLPLPGGARPAFGDLYGTVRPRLDLALNLGMKGKATLRLWIRYDRLSPDLERFPGARSYTLESEAFLQPSGSGLAMSRLGRALAKLKVVGFGIRYVRGQDYYNNQFLRDIDHFQVGVFVDPWTPVIEG